jgi:2-(1,2-epoxy-1,2-dihydrophenyl)acetyl-CoA isomerase
MMLGDRIEAAAAVQIGMIYKAFPDDQFVQGVEDLLAQLAAMPTRALGLTKRALNHSLLNDLGAQLSIEEELQIQAGQTEDYREGVQAFLEKRLPVFKGA